MNSWFLSSACGSGLHCGACRKDRAFREQLARGGRVEAVDFGCPYGVTAEATPPSLPRKVRRLWRELRRWRAAGYALASRAEQQSRLQKCAACEHYMPRGNWGLGQCRLCGCTRAKLWLASASCPASPPRWTAVNDQPSARR